MEATNELFMHSTSFRDVSFIRRDRVFEAHYVITLTFANLTCIGAASSFCGNNKIKTVAEPRAHRRLSCEKSVGNSRPREDHGSKM